MENNQPEVLVIEDEVPIRRFLRTALTNHGYQFVEAGTAQEGLARVVGILVENGVARVRRLSEGDFMTFRTYEGKPALLQVQRILPSESELVAADLVIMTEGDFRALFAFPAGEATDLAVTVGNPRELATIAAKIVGQFPDTRPILKS